MVVGIVGGRVGRERARRAVLEALVDGEDDELARARRACRDSIRRARLVFTPTLSLEYQERICFTRSVGCGHGARRGVPSGPRARARVRSCLRARASGARAMTDSTAADQPPFAPPSSAPPSRPTSPAGTRGAPGRHRRVRLAPQRHRPRRAHHPHPRPRRRARRHARVHRRDERAGRAGAEARRLRQRDALRRPRAERPLRDGRQRGARRGARPRRDRASTSSCFDPLDGSSNIDVNISIGTIFCVLRAPDAAAAACSRARCSPGTQHRRRGLRGLRQRDHARALHRPRRARLHPRPRTSASSSSRTRTSAAPSAATRTRSTRATTSRWDEPREEVDRVDQERGQGRRACPTATATSARSSPTRTARSQGRHLRVPRRQEEPRAASCACSTRRTPWRTSSSRPAARRPTASIASSTSCPRACTTGRRSSSARSTRSTTYRQFMRGERLTSLERPYALSTARLRDGGRLSHARSRRAPRRTCASGAARARGGASSSTQATRSRGASLPKTVLARRFGVRCARARSRTVVAHPLVVGAVGEDELDLVARADVVEVASSGCGATRRCPGT